MSETAKNRRWGIWIIGVVGLLLIYALSVGPAYYLVDSHIVYEHAHYYEAIYTTLFQTSEVLHMTWLLDNYLALWRTPPQFETPYRVHGGVI